MRRKKKFFNADKKKFYYSKSGAINPTIEKKLIIWLTNFGLHCVAVYRFGQLADRIYKKNKLFGIAFCLTYHFFRIVTELLHHVVIDNRADIGPGFYLMHSSNIYIGPVIIGENCTIHHNITIGQGVAGRKNVIPTIGDHVWIGPGAIIYGQVKIGNNSTISAGCVLSKDIPENSLVSGNPGRVIMKDYDNHQFLTFKMPE